MPDYGTSIKALIDLPIRGEYVRDLDAVAYRVARRVLTPTGGYADCGDPVAYVSLDLRQRIGAFLSEADLRQLERECVAAIREEDSIDAVVVTLTLVAGRLTCDVQGTGADGPFGFLMDVGDVTAAILESF